MKIIVIISIDQTLFLSANNQNCAPAKSVLCYQIIGHSEIFKVWLDISANMKFFESLKFILIT